MNKKIFFLLISLLITAGGFSQTSDFNPEMGLSIKASTNGFGGDIYYRPRKMIAIKGGFEYLNFNIKSETLESFVGEDLNVTIPMPTNKSDLMKFSTAAKIKTGALSLTVGYQPLKLFYITAGIGKHLFSSDVTGTPTTDLVFGSHDVPKVGTVTPKISKETLGIFKITAKPKNTLTPYFGIGLGSFVPMNKKVSFALEIGAYYVGNYYLEATMPPGLMSENIDYGSSITQEQKNEYFNTLNKDVNTSISDLKKEVDNAIKDINEKMEKFNFYPVLKLTIGIRTFDFKK